MKYRYAGGFTLVELMVTVVIVGIIAMIAVPSYNGYRVKSSRAAAQTELLELASLQERIFLNTNNYTPNVTGTYNGTAAANNTAATGGLGRSTGKTQDEKYNLTLSITAPDQIFELRAKPVAGTSQAGDGCIIIRENGLRIWHQGSDTCDSANPVPW